MSDRQILLTPGPLTTSTTIREAMLTDYGSRDTAFIQMNREVRSRLVDLIHGGDDFVTVPMQGSGTFAVEATIGTLVPREGKLLVLVNGAYGERIAKICGYAGRAVVKRVWDENQSVDPQVVDEILAADSTITHVAVVHCETATGLLNPIQAIAEVVDRHGKPLIIDAMSSFGAIPLDARETPFAAVVASSNKCLEGAPGFGYALVRKAILEGCQGNAHALTLDLYDQWQGFLKNDQWRFTPPTHVIASFHQALREHEDEGGVAGRHRRYRENCDTLVRGMRDLGFATYLPDDLQAPIIITFRAPEDPKWDFKRFYDLLGERGIVIYPGKLTAIESFRMGCIGRLDTNDMERALTAVREILNEMGVTNRAPVA